MATKETITVSFTAKYGPNINGQWYNVDPKSGLRPDQFEKDKTYDVLVNVSKTGKKYIQQIVGEGTPTLNGVPSTSISAQVTEKPGDDKLLEVVKKEDHKKDYKARDFDAEARGKVACASYAAALSSPALAMYALNKEEYLKLVEDVTERMIKTVFEHQGK